MAISTGKKIAKTGNSIVLSPKPEKKVSIEARKAARTTAGKVNFHDFFVNFIVKFRHS